MGAIRARQPLKKSDPESLFQWNEGAGEYDATCPRCSEELHAPSLSLIKYTFFKHYRTEPCKDMY